MKERQRLKSDEGSEHSREVARSRALDGLRSDHRHGSRQG
jgi:hypothetical protein